MSTEFNCDLHLDIWRADSPWSVDEPDPAKAYAIGSKGEADHIAVRGWVVSPKRCTHGDCGPNPFNGQPGPSRLYERSL
jgi:hypothetical protein